MKTQLTFILIFIMSCHFFAQGYKFTGKVTGEDDIPLPGVNVIVKGTAQGTVTNFDGCFEISVKKEAVLVFSYIGFVTKKVAVSGRKYLEISLEEDIKQLDEIVVIGYAAVKRERVLGSVSSVKADKISAKQRKKQYYKELVQQIQSNSVVQIVEEQVSGVNSTHAPQKSRLLRLPNISAKAHMSAAVIIDGVPASLNALEALNPDQIASIDILRDKSQAAFYGATSGANIVLVSTKVKQDVATNAPLYIVDGQPIKKINNSLIEALPTSRIHKKKHYAKDAAKRKFGEIAKYGCVVITTDTGNFRIQNNESYAIIEENNFQRPTVAPLSTFSIDVDKASYSNVRRMLNTGTAVDPSAVKIEEMINYFDYDYAQPKDEHPFAIATEVAKTPWYKDSKIVKIGLQGKTYTEEELPPSNLTFLIDVSGSMSSPNKLPLLKKAFKLLVQKLRAEDRVSIVVYAGAAGVVLEPTSGKHKQKIIDALEHLEAGGSTAGGAGIELAYKLAAQNLTKKGNNRVILATDGDFNVGASSHKEMTRLIEDKRKSGVFLSVLGFGYGNYKDDTLEILADKGNGNHAYIDTMQEAHKVFGKEFGGTLYTIAKDVKIQVEFNPKKVQAYRLIGYENRMLEAEDFKDDTKDAGELGSGHTVTALYEIIPTGISSPYLKAVEGLKYTTRVESPELSEELFTVKFRYKKPDGTKSIEMVHVQNDVLSKPSEDFKFATAVALFGMQLRGSKYDNKAPLETVLALAKAGRGKDEDGYRSEFIRLVHSYQEVQL